MTTVTSWGHHTDLSTTCGLFWVLWPFAWPTLNSQNISFLLVSASVWTGGRRRSKSRTRTVRGRARRTDAPTYPGTVVAMPEELKSGREQRHRERTQLLSHGQSALLGDCTTKERVVYTDR